MMREQMGRYDKYTGQETEVQLPLYVEGRPLAVIGCKAFLSCKTVERLVLPPTVEAVEDWAFAHMKNLTEIIMPAREIRIGKQVFLGCEGLKRVTLYPVENVEENVGINILGELPGLDRLWASMFRFFPQEDLYKPEEMVEEQGQRRWLCRYDEALESYLRKPDDTGFVPAFIGWFDVEDVDDQRQGYILNCQRDKVKLVFQRLTCGEMPERSLEDYFYSIISKYSAHVEELFLQNPEYGRDICYYKIWQQACKPDRSKIEEFLTKLPWEEPEIRVYLMELLQVVEGDFFAQLEL